MVRIARLAMAAVLPLVASAQPDPLAWFPLQVGSRWIYAHEAKSGNRNHPDIDRWNTEVTVTGRLTIPEGVVVLRQMKQLPNPNEKTTPVAVWNRGIMASDESAPYLVHGSCIYNLDFGEWDAEKQDLSPEFRKYLSEGTVSPDFCFPLETGNAWGNRDRPWAVEPARAGAGSFLPAQYSGAIHIFSAHYGSGTWADVWFQKGVGVVATHSIHNGTYDENTATLLSFTPAP